MGGPLHLARRFFGALDPRGPDPSGEEWATSHLLRGEVVLWRQMSGPDRRHALGVAEEVVRRLGAGATRPVVAAALMHDVGKVDAGLGTFGRVPATLVGIAFGRARLARGSGRIARYVNHPEIGARLLAAAGSDELTVTWTAEHHLPPERWSLPPAITHALKSADDD